MGNEGIAAEKAQLAKATEFDPLTILSNNFTNIIFLFSIYINKLLPETLSDFYSLNIQQIFTEFLYFLLLELGFIEHMQAHHLGAC